MKPRLVLIVAFLVSCGPAFVDAQTPRYARVNSTNANLRETPSATGNSTQDIAEDALVKVLDEKLPWYVVRVGNRVGWMHGDTLEFISTHRGQAPVSGDQVNKLLRPNTCQQLLRCAPAKTGNQQRLTQVGPALGASTEDTSEAARRLLLHQRFRPKGLCGSQFVQLTLVLEHRSPLVNLGLIDR